MSYASSVVGEEPVAPTSYAFQKWFEQEEPHFLDGRAKDIGDSASDQDVESRNAAPLLQSGAGSRSSGLRTPSSAQEPPADADRVLSFHEIMHDDADNPASSSGKQATDQVTPTPGGDLQPACAADGEIKAMWVVFKLSGGFAWISQRASHVTSLAPVGCRHSRSHSPETEEDSTSHPLLSVKELSDEIQVAATSRTGLHGMQTDITGLAGG